MSGRGFPSSVEIPDDRTIERYKKLQRMASVEGGGTPNEMAAARREMERLDSQYPTLRAVLAAGTATAAGAGAPTSDTVYDWLRRAEQFVQGLNGAVTARTLALQETKVNTRILSEGQLRVSATIPVGAVETLLEMREQDRALFAAAVGEMVAKYLTDTIREIDEHG